MISNPFENATTKILRDFCEEYIRLAELIILFDKDEFDLIESAEGEIKKQMLMGVRTAFPNQKAAFKNYLKLKVNLVEKNINRSGAVRDAQVALTRFMKKHSYEVRSMGLSFRNKDLLSPAEIYVNYYYIVERLPGLVLPETYTKKK